MHSPGVGTNAETCVAFNQRGKWSRKCLHYPASLTRDGLSTSFCLSSRNSEPDAQVSCWKQPLCLQKCTLHVVSETNSSNDAVILLHSVLCFKKDIICINDWLPNELFTQLQWRAKETVLTDLPSIHGYSKSAAGLISLLDKETFYFNKTNIDCSSHGNVGNVAFVPSCSPRVWSAVLTASLRTAVPGPSWLVGKVVTSFLQDRVLQAYINDPVSKTLLFL